MIIPPPISYLNSNYIPHSVKPQKEVTHVLPYQVSHFQCVFRLSSTSVGAFNYILHSLIPSSVGSFVATNYPIASVPSKWPHKPWLPKHHPDILSESFDQLFYTKVTTDAEGLTIPLSREWIVHLLLGLATGSMPQTVAALDTVQGFLWPLKSHGHLLNPNNFFASSIQQRNMGMNPATDGARIRKTKVISSGFMRFFEDFSWGYSQDVVIWGHDYSWRTCY